MIPMVRRFLQLQLVHFCYTRRLVLAAAMALSVTAKSDDICFSLFQPTIKLETALIKKAASLHFLGDYFEVAKVTQEAVKTYVELIDPLRLVFTETEYNGLSNLSEKFLKDLQNEVFHSPSRQFFEELNQVAVRRYQTLTQKFFESGEFRRNILERISGITEESLKNNLPRAASSVGLEGHLADHIARQIVIVKKNSAYGGREITDLVAFRLVAREMHNLKSKVDNVLDPKNLPLVIAKAFIRGFDPHSDLLWDLDAKNFRSDLASNYTGVGLTTDYDERGALIRFIVPGGPAARAGMRKGDVITHLSTVELRESHNRFWYSLAAQSTNPLDLLQGPAGTEVQARILRNGNQLKFKMLREDIAAGQAQIEIKLVPTKKGNIAYIQLSSFFENSGAQLKKQILNLKQTSSLAGIVLDLRYNSGGVMYDMVDMLGLFVKSGPAFIKLLSKGSEVIDIPEGNEPIWEGPLVVVTDTNSASASEALSGALRDYGRAIMVGDSQTFGKGTMQNDFTFKKINASLAITGAMFFPPSGRTNQVDGVVPDVILRDADKRSDLEKNYSNAISPSSVQSVLPQGFSMIPNRSKVVTELNRRSQARRTQEAPSFNKITAEAIKILEDLIDLGS